MPLTTPRGYPYPTYGDPADAPTGLKNLADAIDADVAGIAAKVNAPVKVADLASDLIIAHRGGSLIVPENTVEGFEAAATYQHQWLALETDVQLTADGALVCMHDSTVDRTTAATGNVDQFNAGQWRRLKADSSSWFGGGWPDTSLPTFAQYLDRYGGRRVLVPEAKVTTAVQPMTDAIVARGLQASVLIQSFSAPALAPAVAAGIPVMHLVNADGDCLTTQQYADQGIGWVGASTSVTNTKIQELRAAGIRVVVWTVERRWQADQYRSNGIDGIFSDDPLYVSSHWSSYRRSADPFPAGGWPHGFQVTWGSLRGSFSGSRWQPSPAQTYVLQGYMCPIPNPTGTYTLTLDYRVDVIGSDVNRWGGVAICAPDDQGWSDVGAVTENGYHVLLRANGSMEWYKRVNGVLTAGPTMSTPAFAAGASSTITVTVSPTQISAQRSGSAALVWADTTHRGPYIHLGMNAGSTDTGFRCSFASVALS